MLVSLCGLLLCTSAPAAAQLAPVSAPFDHKAHKAVTCQLCHEKEDGQGELKVLTALNCNGCHHATSTSKRCSACHTSGELKPVTLAAGSRSLTFAHSQHTTVTCNGCHTNNARMSATPSCASCHDDHHTALRSCTACHSNVKTIKQHTRSAHVTCSGSGCHKTTVTGTLRTQRNVCLTCHSDKTDHETGGECAACHLFAKK